MPTSIGQYCCHVHPGFKKQLVEKVSMYLSLLYRKAGNFYGVLVFVTFVIDLAVTKIFTHEN